MKLILSPDEVLILLKRYFPSAFLPKDHIVTEIETSGYPFRQFEITILPKAVERKEE